MGTKLISAMISNASGAVAAGCLGAVWCLFGPGKETEKADMAFYLTGYMAHSITGAAIWFDGGWTAK